MELSPEQRKKIYEEERARIEEEAKVKREEKEDKDESSTSLEPNIAALLCYLGIWLTGIVFLIIEQKNRFVRYHAIQSIIVFGVLSIAISVLNNVPFVGWFFSFTIGVLTFVLWIVLMVSAYKGELYKIPGAGDVAERATGLSAEEVGQTGSKEGEAGQTETPPEPSAAQAAAPAAQKDERVESTFRSSRGGRITASSFAIAWSIVLLVFFNFYSRYIAYYQYEGNQWVRYPILTGDYNDWLPILTVTLSLSILAHIILIIYDKYVLRETTLIVLKLFGMAVVFPLWTVNPFDFSAIPSDTAAAIFPVVITIILVGVSIGLVIGTIVSFTLGNLLAFYQKRFINCNS